MKKSQWLVLAILLVSFALSIIYYPSFPDQIPSHWNAAGEVDGYLPKFWGLFLMPIVTLGAVLLMWSLPKIDPLKKNFKKFQAYYDGFVVMFVLFMFYMFMITFVWNLGYEYNMTQMVLPAISLLFIGIGYILPKTKKNWFMGIRTPWTLSSDKVWDKTHEAAGRWFVLAGLLGFLGLFFSDYAIWFMLIPVIFASLMSVVYSYLVWKKE